MEAMTNEPSTSGNHGALDLEARLKSSIQSDWREEVRNRLRAEHPGYTGLSANEQFALFLEYVLHTDMRHYWVVPEHDGVTPSHRPWFVQIEHVEDISQPAKRRYVANGSSGGDGGGGGVSHNRMLKMMVFDGREHHVAIEHVQIPFGAGWPRLGSKLLIDTAAASRGGVFMLTPGTCGVLGGAVDEFEARQRVADEVLQEPVYGRRGPPLQLEAYMEEVEEKVRQRVAGGQGSGIDQTGQSDQIGRDLTRVDGRNGVQGHDQGRIGETTLNSHNTSAPLDASNPNKRHVIEDNSSDDGFGDLAKRQREDPPVGVRAQFPGTNQHVKANNDVIIDLLSSDDE